MIVNFSIEPKQISDTTIVSIDLENQKFPLVCMGRDSYIVSSTIESGINLAKDGVHNLQIGKFCSIAHNVSFVIDLNHNYHNVMMGCSDLVDIKNGNKIKRKGQILIQNDVWIGRGTTIMSGVTIHNGAVVAANSHVVKDVPAYSVVGGNPARIIGYRFSDEIINKLLQIQWWYWKDEKISGNRKYFNLSASDFCNNFYKEQLLKGKQENLDIPKLENTYLYFADFDEPYSLWRRIIDEFVVRFRDQIQTQLLLFIDEEYYLLHKEELDAVNAYIEKTLYIKKSKCTVTLCIESKNKEINMFQYADYYITNRSKDTVMYSCYADLFNIPIISGVDIPIFD